MLAQLIKNKKLLALAAVTAVVVLIIAVPQPAHAFLGIDLIDLTLGALAEIVAKVANIIFFILGLVLRLAAGLFDMVLGSTELQKFVTAPIVTKGWTICRDTANMFFSLILIIVAFATILRIPSYGVKTVLPRIIIAALLINFSLVIGGVVIDFTQVLTKYFFNELKGGSSVSSRITAALNPRVLLGEPANMQKIEQNMPANNQISDEGDTCFDIMGTQTCYTASEMQAAASAQTKAGTDQFLLSAANLVFGSILIIVAIFVFFAGAVLLIIRILYLWFLLILAPLAWLAYIIPGQQSLWNRWWSTFFNQAFFAPAYGLFLFIAVSTLIKSGASGNSFASADTFSPGFIFNYIIVIGLMMGALIAAKSLGAWGASGFMGFAQGQANKAKKWAGKQAMRPVDYGYNKAAVFAGVGAGAGTAALGRGIQKAGFKKWGERVEARGTLRKQALTERPEYKKYKDALGVMSKEQVLREMSSIGPMGAMATKVAADKKFLKDASVAQLRVAEKNYQRLNMQKELGDLKELRPDMIEDKDKLMETLVKAKDKGTIGDWNERVFTGADGKATEEGKKVLAAIGELTNKINKDGTENKYWDPLTAKKFTDAGAKWSRKTRSAAGTAFRQTIQDGTVTPDMRKFYASASGALQEAFSDADKNYDPKFNDTVKELVRGMTNNQISSLQTDADFERAAPFMTKRQVTNIRGEVSGTHKDIIYNNATGEAKEYMQNSDAWKTKEATKPTPFSNA